MSWKVMECCKDNVVIIVDHALNFQMAEDGIFADLWQKVLDGNPELSLDITKRCRYLYKTSQPLICVGDKTAVIGQLSKAAEGRCNWGVVPEEFFPTNFALALPERTPFLSMFDRLWVTCIEPVMRMSLIRKQNLRKNVTINQTWVQIGST